jgi:hypothetical protein
MPSRADEKRAVSWRAGLALSLLASPWVHAEDPACKTPLDAVTRVLATPNHQFVTRTDAGTGGMPRHSEIIDTGIAMYAGAGGKWRLSPLSPQDMQNRLIEGQKQARVTTCRLVREESIDGASAEVYSIHSETDAGVSDTTLWVSKADGLPLKQEIDTAGGGAGGKSHSEVRFVYTDVKAPPGF